MWGINRILLSLNDAAQTVPYCSAAAGKLVCPCSQIYQQIKQSCLRFYLSLSPLGNAGVCALLIGSPGVSPLLQCSAVVPHCMQGLHGGRFNCESLCNLCWFFFTRTFGTKDLKCLYLCRNTNTWHSSVLDQRLRNSMQRLT